MVQGGDQGVCGQALQCLLVCLNFKARFNEGVRFRRTLFHLLNVVYVLFTEFPNAYKHLFGKLLKKAMYCISQVYIENQSENSLHKPIYFHSFLLLVSFWF